MFLNEEFNVATLPTGTKNFDPLPPGWYGASITEAELKTTKDGSGQYIKVRYTITGPTHEGRVVFGNLNTRNASLKAEEIGRAQLGDVMRAIGVPSVSDTDQLIGGVLQIKIVIRPADGQYAEQNEIKGYKANDGSALVFGTGSKSAPAALIKGEMKSVKAAPPWAKK